MQTITIEAPCTAAAVRAAETHAAGETVRLAFTETGRVWGQITIGQLTDSRSSAMPLYAHGTADMSTKAPRGHCGAHWPTGDTAATRHALTIVIERARRMARA